MGAQTFITYQAGEDVDQAFRAACQQAQYAHGHSGYSGTIAEKHSFIVIDRVPRLRVEANNEAAHLLVAEDPRIDDKWGSAGALPVTEPGGPMSPRIIGWLFFGWASS